MRIEDRQLIQELLAYERDDVVSLYVPVDPADPRNQRPPGQEWWRSKAKEMLNDLDVGQDRQDRMDFRAVIENTGVLPIGPG